MPAATMARFQILLAAVLFSTGGAAVKATTWTAWEVAGLRSGIAALALAVAMPSWRRFWHLRILVGGAAYAATMILYVAGNKLTTAANVIFLQATAPIYLLVLGPWLLGERPNRRDMINAAALGAGLILFFAGVDARQATAPEPFWGNVLGACTGLSWALTLVALRWLARGAGIRGSEPAGAAVVCGNMLACLVCLPLAWPLTDGTSLDWTIVAYLGVFQIGAAYIALTRGVRRVAAFEVALLLLLEPVLNAFWAWLVHSERPGPWSFVGCAVILVATLSRALRRDDPGAIAS